jgi:hypothetical protein
MKTGAAASAGRRLLVRSSISGMMRLASVMLFLLVMLLKSSILWTLENSLRNAKSRSVASDINGT